MFFLKILFSKLLFFILNFKLEFPCLSIILLINKFTSTEIIKKMLYETLINKDISNLNPRESENIANSISLMLNSEPAINKISSKNLATNNKIKSMIIKSL